MTSRLHKCLHRLRAHTRQEDGQTLIEMLVVILIVGILIGGGATFLISLFNASARSFQSFQQQTTLQQATGFISSRLNAMTSSDDIGTTINTGSVNAGIGITVNCSTSPADCINPLSVAGDQLVFQSQGTCYRLYYIQSSQQLDVASDAPISGSCTGTPIDPVRGPNEIAPEACGAANYDPVLDDPSDTSNSCVSGLPESYTVAQLAGDITATAPSHGAPTTGVCGTGSPPSSYPTLQVFTYCNGGLSAAGQPNSSLDPPDVAAMGAATSGSVVHSAWYTDWNDGGGTPVSDSANDNYSTCSSSAVGKPTSCILGVYLSLYAASGSTAPDAAQTQPFQELITLGH